MESSESSDEMFANGYYTMNGSNWGNLTHPPAPAVALYEASPAIIALLAVFYSSISLLALIGNGLVVLIIAGNKRMQSVTNFLLANLASSDILIAVAAVPFQFQGTSWFKGVSLGGQAQDDTFEISMCSCFIAVNAS